MLAPIIAPPKRRQSREFKPARYSRRIILAKLRQEVMVLRTMGHEYGAIARMLRIEEEDARDLCKQHRHKEPPHRLTRRAINVLLHGRHAHLGGKTIAKRARHLPQIAATYSAEELLAEPGIGHATAMEIQLWLESWGLSLRGWDSFQPFSSEAQGERQ